MLLQYLLNTSRCSGLPMTVHTHTLTRTDLPKNAVAGVGTRREATEAKSLFALNVSQHKCEVLADLVDCQAAG